MQLPLPPQAYSVLDLSQTRSQIAQALTAQQQALSALQASAGTTTIWPQWDLRYWAQQASITLGTGNDQPAFDAAHAAMAAKAGSAMLYVYVPPGLYMIDQVKLYSSAGFYCDVGAAMLRQKTQATPKPIVVFGDIDDTTDQGSTASCVTFWGFKIDGQFTYDWIDAPVDETIPGLMHYATSEYNGGDPERNIIVGQAGVYLRGAFADAAYGTPPTISGNSPFYPNGGGDAQHRIGELEICNIAGDGFTYQGTGAGVMGPIRVAAAGGRGIVLNAYDMHFTTLDAGGCGFEGLVIRGQTSDCRIFAAKVWFCGLRANAGNVAAGGLAQDAGHQAGCWIDGPANLVAVIESQDAVGSAFRIDSPIQCQLTLNANWVGLPPSQQAADCGGIDLNPARYLTTQSIFGGYIHAVVSPVFAGGTGPYPRIKYAIKASSKILGTEIRLAQKGLPGDDTTDNVLPSWVQGRATVFGSYTPTLPSDGQTLVINGSTITFEGATTIAAVAAQINAATITGVKAAVSGYESLLEITGESPFAVSGSGSSYGALTFGGTALAGLGLVGLSSDNISIASQSYYDRALFSFHNFHWPIQGWNYNSTGSIGFGVNNLGALTGVVSKDTGQVTMLAEGRGVYNAQITVFDNVANTFPALLQGGVDPGGEVNIGFFGQTPAPQQSLGAGPLPTDGSATNAQLATAINTLLTALLNNGLGAFS